MDENREAFHYTYSAREQEEIKRIREKYAPPAREEALMEQLRKLDASATRTANIVAFTLGIISILIMGVGMCCTTVWADTLFIPGILIGIAGIAGMMIVYPIYKGMVKRKREKLAPEIMRLSEELMK